MQTTNVIKNYTVSILPKAKNISKYKKIVASFFVVFLICCIIIKPNICINSVYSGLAVWAKCVLPSLLPFMFFTKLLTNLNFISKLTSKFYKINSVLFKAPKISSYIFLMSIISGYPVGAKMISEYHKMGLITTKQSNKLSTFCSTSGPLFIIGSVGTAMLKDVKLGYILFISHLLGSILNGILFRNFFVENLKNDSNIELKCDKNFEKLLKNNQKNTKILQKNDSFNQNLLASSMKDSILSVLIVGGWIAIAFLVIDIFNELNLFYPINSLLEIIGLKNGISNALTSGIFEVNKGCLMLSNLNVSKTIIATLASFLIGFGGICVFLQATSFLKEANVNFKFYIMQKISHGILSAVICFLICLAFKL